MRILDLVRLWFTLIGINGLGNAQYHFDPPPPPPPQPGQPEFANLKPAPDGTENEVWKYMRERGDTMFMATLSQSFSSYLPQNSTVRTQFENCVRTVFNSRQYAQCLVPIMRRRLRQLKIQEQAKKEKEAEQKFRENFKRDSPSSETSKTADGMTIKHVKGKWSDMVLPAVEVPTQTQPPPQPTAGGQDAHLQEMSVNVANFLADFVRHLKNMTGPWGRMPDLDAAIRQQKYPEPRLPKNGFPQLVGLTTETGKADDSVFHILIRNIMTAPLFLMKDSIQMAKMRKEKKAEQILRTKRQVPQPVDNFNFLSPTLLNVFDNGKSSKPSFLSPDFLSLFDSPNSIASIPQLLSALPPEQQVAWLRFFLEVTGAADYMRMIESEKFQDLLDAASLSWYGNQTVPYKKVFDAKYLSVGEIFQDLNKPQMDEINQRGFSFLDEPQMKKVYGEQLDDPDFFPYDIKEYFKMGKIEKEELLIDIVDAMANNYYQTEEEAFVTEAPEPTPGPRRKRQPKFASPCNAAPYSGGTTGVIYLAAPQILCPSIFSYVILGPLILSPYVLSPYVFGPFILSPEVLNPFILSPYVLSPTIVNPVVLSPGILNPTVLSPPILAPFVLSPQILSPTVFSPLILSPTVLNPGILSPSVGSPNILSPFVMSPTILSPAVLFVNVLSPGLLSPGILSPSDGPNILSPCALCRKRKKRETSKNGNGTRYFDQIEFSKRMYWVDDYDEQTLAQEQFFKRKYYDQDPKFLRYLEELQKLFYDHGRS